MCAVVALNLAACSRTIRSQRDEIAVFIWSGELENGKSAQLSFDDRKAYFTASGDDYELAIRGVCQIDDECFVILDEETHNTYCFDYILHGDSLELTYSGGTIILDKTTNDEG